MAKLGKSPRGRVEEEVLLVVFFQGLVALVRAADVFIFRGSFSG